VIRIADSIPGQSAGDPRHGAFQLTSSIASAVVIKDGDLFFLAQPNGDVPLGGRHGFGLYYHDCRFLDGYELRVAGAPARELVSTATEGRRSITELTNPTIRTDAGTLAGEALGIRWERTADAERLALCERLSVENFGLDPIRLPLTLTWAAAFEDVFVVRGMPPGRRGRLEPPRWSDGVLTFVYRGADGVSRTLAIAVSPPADVTDGASATIHLDLRAGGRVTISVVLSVAEAASPSRGPLAPSDRAIVAPGYRARRRSARRLDAPLRLVSDSRAFDDVVERSLRDLRILRTELRGCRFYAAGVPWYVALFGRDSILASLETLAWEPDIAGETLRLLASYQGQRIDERRGEQPGEILHELRAGEMARLGEIPHDSLARPPIALVEVQGYAFLARHGIADLYERVGDHARAATLREQADGLRQRFNHDYWLEDKDCLALALQRGGDTAAVVSSNAGQALWTGIVDADKARRTARRLMADDMWTGWGIRTLSSRERRYNPVGYHVGTVWPHDNALIAAGFRHYGYDDDALRIFTAILDAATHFTHERLPEVFCGFHRRDYPVPVHYPVACHPQAWAAGAVPYLLERCLGLEPNAFDRQLRLVRPILPDVLRRLEVERLRVGDASVDLRFERTPDGRVTTEVRRVEGRLDVVIERGD
jgi:glycogen debranching enzyme